MAQILPQPGEILPNTTFLETGANLVHALAKFHLTFTRRLRSPLDFHTVRRRSRAFVSTDIDHKSSIDRM